MSQYIVQGIFAVAGIIALLAAILPETPSLSYKM